MIFEGAPKIRAWALLERWGISFPKFGMYGVLSETGTNFPKIRDMLCEIRDELNPRFSMLQPSEDQIPPNKQKKTAGLLPTFSANRTNDGALQPLTHGRPTWPSTSAAPCLAGCSGPRAARLRYIAGSWGAPVCSGEDGRMHEAESGGGSWPRGGGGEREARCQ